MKERALFRDSPEDSWKSDSEEFWILSEDSEETLQRFWKSWLPHLHSAINSISFTDPTILGLDHWRSICNVERGPKSYTTQSWPKHRCWYKRQPDYVKPGWAKEVDTTINTRYCVYYGIRCDQKQIQACEEKTLDDAVNA